MGINAAHEERAKQKGLDADEARLLAQKARVLFLIANLGIVLLNMASGYVVYRQTNSITMELDLVGFLMDILGLLINMTVEVMKRHTTDARRTLSLDLSGCFLSMVSLAVMATWGFRNAWRREEDAVSIRLPRLVLPTEDRVDHVGTMFIYSLFSLTLSFTTLTIFVMWFKSMYPHGFAEEDRLNTVSSLAHTIVDFTGTCTLLVTSLTMLIQEEQGAARWKKFQEVTHDDVMGALVIVTVTGLTIMLLTSEALKSLSRSHLCGYGPCSSKYKRPGWQDTQSDERAVLAGAVRSDYGSSQA